MGVKHDIRMIALLFFAFWCGGLFDRAVQGAGNQFMICLEIVGIVISLLIVMYMNKKIAQ